MRIASPRPTAAARNLAMKTKRGKLLRAALRVIGIVPVELSLLDSAIETLAALVTGNAVVLKPSDSRRWLVELQRLLHAAGLDPISCR